MFRGVILRSLIEKKLNRYSERYHTQFIIEEAGLKGINGIYFNKIKVIPNDRDTLLKIGSLQGRLKVWPLLTGKIRFKSVDIDGMDWRLIKKDTIDNFSFLFKHSGIKENITDSVHIDYAAKFTKLFDALFERIPMNVNLFHFKLLNKINNYQFNMATDTFAMVEHQFNSKISIKEGKSKQIIQVNGLVNSDDQVANVKVYNPAKGKVFIPYLDKEWNMKFEFDTIQFSTTNNTLVTGEDGFVVNGGVKINGLKFEQDKIALNPISVDSCSVQFKFKAGETFLELDSATQITFNGFDFHTYLKYNVLPTKQISFQLMKEPFESQLLFDALPHGLFTTLDGIKTSGLLGYRLDFFVDLSQPDSLLFSSSVQKKQFKIAKFGAADLTKMNQTFVQTVYDNGNPVRTILVGPESPDFTPLAEIPAWLKDAILISEDGEFYYHKGFYGAAFQQSIAKNIKEKRFARGASTISMQLIKNVYLNRNKTIVRKLEEIMLVWLIENHGLCTKDRMYEIYLNIIEWGPDVFGIKEAARFYFNKKPADLSLSESLYLASIIPHPKWFKYSFDEAGHLKPNLSVYFNLIAGKLLKRGKISEIEMTNLIPDVNLIGPAKQYVLKDSLPFDSLIFRDDLQKFEL
jgi:hypothetical protein